jgi:hypothetical protein
MDSAMSVVLTTYLSLLDRVFSRDQKPPKQHNLCSGSSGASHAILMHGEFGASL